MCEKYIKEKIVDLLSSEAIHLTSIQEKNKNIPVKQKMLYWSEGKGRLFEFINKI
jgi:hypothetical protein